MTQVARILAVLAEGPATTPEVVAETGLPLKHCCAHLRSLWQRGRVTRAPFKRDRLAPTFLYSAVSELGDPHD